MTTEASTTVEPQPRPPPRVIRVAKPEGVIAPATTIVTFGFILLGCGCAALCLGLALRTWVVWLGAAIVLASTVFLSWWPRHVKRAQQRHAAYLTRFRERGEDPIALELATRWRTSRGLPDNEVKAVLAASPATDSSRGRIVCLGKIEVPEVGDIFFEPEIITPTRYFARQLVFIPIAGALIFLWLLQQAGVIPGKPIQLGSFGYFLAMGFGVGAAWVWRTAIRPTYIRLAPGVVQIMEYHYGKRKPTIRSYPADGKTLAILRGKTTGKAPRNLTLTLLRGQQKDSIELWRTRKRDNAIERTWQALLSTAPTPPLSEEELVG